MSEETKTLVKRRIKAEVTEEKHDPIPMRNKYVSGICPTCQNEYTDLEGHYIKFSTHRKIKK